MNINDIEVDLNIRLPESYKQLVESLNEYEYIYFNEDQENFPEDEGVAWFFYGMELLLRECEIEHIGKRPTYRQLELYARLDSEMRHTSHAFCDEGEISRERISKGFVIAIDNGDLLYIDTTDSNSVWRYIHDSGDVKRLSPSFDDWLSSATRDNE